MIYDVIKNSIATELLDRNIKLNSVFIKKSYFKVPKEVRISCKHFLIRKFQIVERFNEPHLIIHEILTLKISLKFIKNE